MKLKNHWKRFWTLDRHHAEGFTLVELIVVIAILAILAGVGIPVYSGYITKTNKTADQTLASQIKYAIELYYYSNPDQVETGTVTLYLDKGPVASNQFLANALTASLGDNYSGVDSPYKLKYDGWTSSYSGSSFSGEEEELLEDVSFLTDELAPVIKNLSGDNFNQWLSNNNISSDNEVTLADAAVLYVADCTKAQDADSLVAAMCTGNLGAVQQVFGTSGGASIATAAATYALIEGFCYYADGIVGGTTYRDTLEDEIDARADGITEVEKAAEEVFNSLSVILAIEGAQNLFVEYQKDRAQKDAQAYVDLMSTVSDAKGVMKDNIGKDDCFTGDMVSGLFASYAEGAIIVTAIEQTDGSLLIKNTAE